ncbi:type VI secretion system protein TssA [Aquariibacter albus]|uniref:Type VI secretion system protein TssA n=1 Tax=Aquariibacter albus TaxID=2759899 RepID=A0A839HNU3_9BURK|nr:type VI secretion system protein TssA [Aquariibacter albus]MBB1163152.1 type VI secretion system protein TssA [Aquariibacter albus]
MADYSIDTWLEPIDGAPCGENLEYDLEFFELNQSLAGKPETQFAPAEPPQWMVVREQAESLMTRTRDLRVVMAWGRACVNLDGVQGLTPILKLLTGLMEAFWSEVHPQLDPDDGDPFSRLSVLGGLGKWEDLLGDVRNALLLPDRRLGGLRVRDVEVALDRLAPRPGDSPRTLGQIQGLLGDLPELASQLRDVHTHAMQAARDLQALMNSRFGGDVAVDLADLRGLLDALRQALPDEAAVLDAAADGPALASERYSRAAEADADLGSRVLSTPSRAGGTAGRIESRQDVIQALQRICDYLERHEPTNPAQLLLRRAQRLIDKGFMQLVQDLAPDALAEVARIMGVDPDSIPRIGADDGSS